MFEHRYSCLSITLHWLMFFLLIAVYACIELREFYPKGSDPREALKTWHFMLGLSVFLLIWIRLFARFLTPTPIIAPPINAWQYYTANTVKFLLYAFMIIMPLAGWVILSAEGKEIPFFGMQLPALFEQNKAIAESVEEIHKTAGQIAYFVIALHIFAGFYHHYVLRDNTLIRILPRHFFLTNTKARTK